MCPYIIRKTHAHFHNSHIIHSYYAIQYGYSPTSQFVFIRTTEHTNSQCIRQQNCPRMGPRSIELYTAHQSHTLAGQPYIAYSIHTGHQRVYTSLWSSQTHIRWWGIKTRLVVRLPWSRGSARQIIEGAPCLTRGKLGPCWGSLHGFGRERGRGIYLPSRGHNSI